MRLRNAVCGCLGLALALATVACGGGEAPQPADTTAAPAAAAGGGGGKVDPATAGDVKGAVMLDGAAPKNDPIKMNADPVCVKQNSAPQFQETYTVGADGKSLANVFVYVQDGLGHYQYDPTSGTAHIA